ncbi:MAG: transglycosylase SLT domain-containing protein [Ferruginibacter sp.]
MKSILRRLIVCVSFMLAGFFSYGHDIFFCGEKIPLDDAFVRDKLMSIIKKQIGLVNLPDLRSRIDKYMSRVEDYLAKSNLPQDFKYLAIVESGFKTDVESWAHARGFWQLMPATARDWNLIVNETTDERTDFDKSTLAACQEIIRNYKYIQKSCKINSWVLTAAAYNHGMGSITNAVRKQNENNYFALELNPETAAYVYKIIAIKELFEYPELYMNNFGYNIFSTRKISDVQPGYDSKKTDVSLGNMKFDLNAKDGAHPSDLGQGNVQNAINTNRTIVPGYKIISARITQKYKNLKDGDLVTFILDDDLEVGSRFTAKGQPIIGTAWIIGDRVQIDLGYGHKVILYDFDIKKGIGLSELKKKRPAVLLHVAITNRKR